MVWSEYTFKYTAKVHCGYCNVKKKKMSCQCRHVTYDFCLVFIKGKNDIDKNVLLHILHVFVIHLPESMIIIRFGIHRGNVLFLYCTIHSITSHIFYFMVLAEIDPYPVHLFFLSLCLSFFSLLYFEDADLPVQDCRSSKITLFYFSQSASVTPPFLDPCSLCPVARPGSLYLPDRKVQRKSILKRRMM